MKTFEYTDGVVTPGSSLATSLFYNKHTKEFLIKFRANGNHRVYFDIDVRDWEEITAQNVSVGGYYNAYIKGEDSEDYGTDVTVKKVESQHKVQPVKMPTTFSPNISTTTGDITFKAVTSLTHAYTVVADLNGVGVSFDVNAASDSDAVAAFTDYVSRLNATGQWVTKSVTRHF